MANTICNNRAFPSAVMDFMIQDVQGNKEYHVNIIRWLQREKKKMKDRKRKERRKANSRLSAYTLLG